MNERREKSTFQLLPPGVCLLEKFALKNDFKLIRFAFEVRQKFEAVPSE